MHLLNLKTSDGYEVAVPVALPQSITFDCFLPGVGIAKACMWPTSSDPVHAEVGYMENWIKYGRSIIRDHLQESAAVEQADDVLAYVLDRLMSHPEWLTKNAPEYLSAIVSIADIVHHEACAREAWEALPENVRQAHRRLGPEPKDPSSFPADLPSAVAMAAYVEVLVEQAQKAATAAAKRREDAWMAEQREEALEAAASSRADAAVDSWKDGR